MNLLTTTRFDFRKCNYCIKLSRGNISDVCGKCEKKAREYLKTIYTKENILLTICHLTPRHRQRKKLYSFSAFLYYGRLYNVLYVIIRDGHFDLKITEEQYDYDFDNSCELFNELINNLTKSLKIHDMIKC